MTESVQIATDVQIVKLEPMRVASAWGFGTNPEEVAAGKLMAWAAAKGLLDESKSPRIFGFNNPNPSAGSPNYGYEFWIVVEPDLVPDGDIRVVDFSGGLYAVMPMEEIEDPYTDIPAAWRRLNSWIAESGHQMGSHQWLEAHNPQCKLIALYYPIAG
jgi:DNA gyrase inhibitor GyrI